MKRQNILVSLNVQFPNPVQPPQWGAPVIMTSASVVLDVNGQAKYQPAYSQTPVTSSDITDEILEMLQRQLAEVGLMVSRSEVEHEMPITSK